LDLRCARCLYCPVCFNKAIINKALKDGEKVYFYMCQCCKWNSISIGITEKNMMDIYAKQTFASQQKGRDKFKVFEALLSQLCLTQEEIMKREKKEVRQKKTNLLEEYKGKSAREKKKYTHEDFARDEERRLKIRDDQMLNIGNSTTEEIISGRLELKDLDKEELKKGFKDYLGKLSTGYWFRYN
jgi:predicted GIY-YIG superfamily endonuclease